MRWHTFLLVTLFAGCAHDPLAGGKTMTFTGHCFNGELGGHNYKDECTGTIVQMDFPSGFSSLIVPLTGDRKVIFVAAQDPKLYRSNTSWMSVQIALMTGSEEHDYKGVVSCDWSRERPTPHWIQCIGQAESQVAFFAFETDGSMPVLGSTDGRN